MFIAPQTAGTCTVQRDKNKSITTIVALGIFFVFLFLQILHLYKFNTALLTSAEPFHNSSINLGIENSPTVSI